jgi:hypothetical protein
MAFYIAAAVFPSFLWLNLNVLETRSLTFMAVSWPLQLLAFPLAAWQVRQCFHGGPHDRRQAAPLRASA